MFPLPADPLGRADEEVDTAVEEKLRSVLRAGGRRGLVLLRLR